VHIGAGHEIWFSYPTGDTLPATADGRFRGNARQVLSLSEEKGLEITARSLWTEWTGTPIDYNYAQGLLEQYNSDDR
jgi:hypothetical protein